MTRANAEANEANDAAEAVRPEPGHMSLKQISWALSYPSAAVQKHFRDMIAPAQAANDSVRRRR